MFTHAVPPTPEVAELARVYLELKAQEKALAEAKETLSARLKLAAETVTAQAGLDPEDTKVLFEGQDLAVYVTPTETWRVDATRLKKEQPHLYAAYAKKSVSRRLEVKGL